MIGIVTTNMKPTLHLGISISMWMSGTSFLGSESELFLAELHRGKVQDKPREVHLPGECIDICLGWQLKHIQGR